MSKYVGFFMLLAAAMLLVGCSRQQDAPSTSPAEVAGGDNYGPFQKFCNISVE